MRLAIVDDEEVFRSQIEKTINQVYGREDVTCFLYSDGNEILKSLDNGNHYDAIFLDIEMKSCDGMTTAKTIRSLRNNTPIIFVTSHVEMAMDGYEVAAFRFLGKPVDPVRLKAVLTDLEEMLYKESAITLSVDGENRIIPVQNIQFIESMNNDVVYHIGLGDKAEDIKIRSKLTDVMTSLSERSRDFYKIHRCTIVNMKNIKLFKNTEVTMKDGTILPIARGEQAKFRQMMFDFVKRTSR